MNIEKRAMELIQRNFHASANPDDLCADIARLVREAVAECESEWVREMERADKETDGSIERQGLVRINHRRTETIHGHEVGVIDFWLAPPKGHVLTDDGKVRLLRGELNFCADDGSVVGRHCEVWFNQPTSKGPVQRLWVFSPVRDTLYSTESKAAEAAGRGEG